MVQGKRGEIATVITLGALLVIGAATLVSSIVLNSDKKVTTNSKASEVSCRDNPEAPPAGFTWKADCGKPCHENSDCPVSTDSDNVNPDTSRWCYGFKGNSGTWSDWRCMMLVKGSSANPAPVDSTGGGQTSQAPQNPAGQTGSVRVTNAPAAPAQPSGEACSSPNTVLNMCVREECDTGLGKWVTIQKYCGADGKTTEKPGSNTGRDCSASGRQNCAGAAAPAAPVAPVAPAAPAGGTAQAPAQPASVATATRGSSNNVCKYNGNMSILEGRTSCAADNPNIVLSCVKGGTEPSRDDCPNGCNSETGRCFDAPNTQRPATGGQICTPGARECAGLKGSEYKSVNQCNSSGTRWSGSACAGDAVCDPNNVNVGCVAPTPRTAPATNPEIYSKKGRIEIFIPFSSPGLFKYYGKELLALHYIGGSNYQLYTTEDCGLIGLGCRRYNPNQQESTLDEKGFTLVYTDIDRFYKHNISWNQSKDDPIHYSIMIASYAETIYQTDNIYFKNYDQTNWRDESKKPIDLTKNIRLVHINSWNRQADANFSPQAAIVKMALPISRFQVGDGEVTPYTQGTLFDLNKPLTLVFTNLMPGITRLPDSVGFFMGYDCSSADFSKNVHQVIYLLTPDLGSGEVNVDPPYKLTCDL